MIGLDNLHHFVSSVKHVIGLDDPDLQHGRLGRKKADEDSRRAVARHVTANRDVFRPGALPGQAKSH
jgi:hypothetical protein